MLQIVSGVNRSDGIIVVLERRDILKLIFLEYSRTNYYGDLRLTHRAHPSVCLIDPERT